MPVQVISGMTDSPGPEDGLAEEFRQQYPTEANEAFDPPYEFHEDTIRVEVLVDESVDMPDEAPVDVSPGAVWRVTDESHVMHLGERPFWAMQRRARDAERVNDALLNIWITVRQNKHAERVSLRVGTDLIPFEAEDALSWSRHEFEEWANEYLSSLCDSEGNLRHESDWFDTYAWAREQVDARAASFYALKEREASVA